MLTVLARTRRAIAGEDATWVGILLTGRINAVTRMGDLLGTLQPGAIVGEMAFFRGEKRMCDLVSDGPVMLATMLFTDIPALLMANPKAANKLLLCFGTAAAYKLVFPHPLPEGNLTDKAGSSRRGKTVMDLAAMYAPAVDALVALGLLNFEAAELIKWLTITEFRVNQVVLQEAKELRHVTLVLRGTVLDGEVTHAAGEFIGGWWLLTGIPVTRKVIGGSGGGVLGTISLPQIEELSRSNVELALKLFKLVGIGATRRYHSAACRNSWHARAVACRAHVPRGHPSPATWPPLACGAPKLRQSVCLGMAGTTRRRSTRSGML